MRTPCCLLVLASLFVASAGGCGRRGSETRTSASTTTTTAAPAVAWKLDIPGEKLRSGRVRTQPAGHEEALISGLATASLAWAKACAADIESVLTTHPTLTTSLSLHLDEAGAIKQAGTAVPAGATSEGTTFTAIARCLIAQASLAQGQKLRAGTGPALQAWVAVDFSRVRP